MREIGRKQEFKENDKYIRFVLFYFVLCYVVRNTRYWNGLDSAYLDYTVALIQISATKGDFNSNTNVMDEQNKYWLYWVNRYFSILFSFVSSLS